MKLECRRFEFCPQVTAKLGRMGEKIAEVPICRRGPPDICHLWQIETQGENFR